MKHKLTCLQEQASFEWMECYDCRKHVGEAWGYWEVAVPPRSSTVLTRNGNTVSTLMYQWFCERCCKQKGWLW